MYARRRRAMEGVLGRFDRCGDAPRRARKRRVRQRCCCRLLQNVDFDRILLGCWRPGSTNTLKHNPKGRLTWQAGVKLGDCCTSHTLPTHCSNWVSRGSCCRNIYHVCSDCPSFGLQFSFRCFGRHRAAKQARPLRSWEMTMECSW